MTEKERRRILASIIPMFLFMLLLFFKSNFRGFLGWETLFISLYKQIISIAMPYAVINYLPIKSKALNGCVFFAFFCYIDTFVVIETDFFTSIWDYVLLGIGLLCMFAIYLFSIKFAKNKENEKYTKNKRIRDIIIFWCISAIQLAVMLYLSFAKFEF